MEKILILSVGGSSEPVINALRFYQPGFIYFFCSSGAKGSALTIAAPGNPCGDSRKSQCPKCGCEYHLDNPKGKAIAFQAGLSEEQYEIIEVDDPDNLDKCYFRIATLAKSIKDKHPRAQVMANYTGGTKTMSVAIALVGVITEEWDLSLNKGPRLDIIKVRTGDTPVVVNKWQIFSQQQQELVAKALRSYNYALAESLISASLSHPLEASWEKKLLKRRQICQAFDYWDKFDHGKALELLQPYGQDFSAYLIILKKILKRTRGSGYELVADLLNNAERRAAQKRYDDAIARLYRATELFAQLRLEKTRGYKSGRLSLKELPPELRPIYKKYVKGDDNLLILGLREDYELLNRFKDHLGKAFKENEGRILNALNYRNSSIFAHGIVPSEEKDYQLVSGELKGLLLNVSKKINLNLELKQLPQEEILKE